jgi:hypothetical protein
MSLIIYKKMSLSNLDVSTSFNVFMDTILHYYNTAFPINTVYRINVKDYINRYQIIYTRGIKKLTEEQMMSMF